ncbi:MAG: NUDIX domain-containing protein [Candidatus Nomurabacteria bacterium]|jgi:8-oxo-dGTP pyrophosphatase MutT (NUDIX family)|nr:NUDIX domain-containing protein [Candidatus Nomurabacteria bacterium]
MQKHFCVEVYVYNRKKQQFLLVHHKKLGKWVQPGGHVDPEESPEEAAIREVKEETGLDVCLIGKRVPRASDYILPLALQKNVISKDHIHMDFVYLAETRGCRKAVLNQAESHGIGWFSLQEILDPSFNTFDDVRWWCEKIVNEKS